MDLNQAFGWLSLIQIGFLVFLLLYLATYCRTHPALLLMITVIGQSFIKEIIYTYVFLVDPKDIFGTVPALVLLITASKIAEITVLSFLWWTAALRPSLDKDGWRGTILPKIDDATCDAGR